jgi:hypothetical protein
MLPRTCNGDGSNGDDSNGDDSNGDDSYGDDSRSNSATFHGDTSNQTIETASAHAHDVTGGIAAKLQAAVGVVVGCGIPVFVVEVGTASAAQALAGQVPDTCTVIRRNEAAWRRVVHGATAKSANPAR